MEVGRARGTRRWEVMGYSGQVQRRARGGRDGPRGAQWLLCGPGALPLLPATWETSHFIALSLSSSFVCKRASA